MPLCNRTLRSVTEIVFVSMMNLERNYEVRGDGDSIALLFHKKSTYSRFSGVQCRPLELGDILGGGLRFVCLSRAAYQ
jgi:hypothetical protein